MNKYNKGLLIILLVALICASGNVIAQNRSWKRGVSANYLHPAGVDLLAPGVSWAYNWGGEPANLILGEKIEFLPMVWGAYQGQLDAAKSYLEGGAQPSHILVLNEPNLRGQAFITPQASADWMKHVHTTLSSYGIPLIGPQMSLGSSVEDSITAYDPLQQKDVTYTDMNSFLDAYNYYVEDGLDEGIAVHPYGGVGEMQWAVNSAYDRSGEPVWVTEFAYWNAGSVDELYDYMISALDYLEHSPRVARYAWFKADLGSRGRLSLLSTNQTELTRLGELYVNYPVYDPGYYYPVNTRIEAEAYMQKSTSMQMQTSDIEGGMGALFNSRSFGWADYQINVEEAGTYTIRMRISKESYPELLEPVNTNVENPATGIERDLLMTTELEAGQQTLRIWFKRLGAKFDWFEVLPGVRK